MSDDLISREALRKVFHERIYYFDKSSWDEANALIDNAPTIPIQRDVWELYQRYQPRLATNVYEFGVELKELLGRYEKGGRQ